MTRRTFVGLAAGGAAAANRRKILIVCVDGCGPDYLKQSDVPNLRRMMREGFYTEGESVIPSVTNVNNASIATASWPSDHGITGNFYYDRAAGREHYMESAEFLLRPALFVRARQAGFRTAFVTAKEKLKHLLARDADTALVGEHHEKAYSPDVNYWCLRAARKILAEGYSFIYLATTDYMMHTYPPDDERSQDHMRRLDRLLGEILDQERDLELYLTADHGMSPKTEAVDLTRLLASKGIDAEAVPIIKDRYVAHHSNLGGAAYLYLKQARDLERSFDLLRRTAGVAEIYRTREAAARFRLRADRIGDIFLLADRHVAFGSLERVREDVSIRSHGSRFECRVPILCYGRKAARRSYRNNLDITGNLDWTLL